MLEHLRTEFLKQTPQTKKDIIGKLLEEVEIYQIAPYLYVLRMLWIKPMTDGRDDIAFLWRTTATKRRWTSKENEILRELYPETEMLTLMKALPSRSACQIKVQASTLGIRRQRASSTPFYRNISWQDLEAACAETGEVSKEQKALWEEINCLARSTNKRGQIAALWLLPLGEISVLRLLVNKGKEELLSRL